MEEFCKIKISGKARSLFLILQVVIFLSFGFLSLTVAGVTSTNPVKKSMISRYRPTIDIAQYALHQGNVRSASLLEGFIPLYPSAPNNLSFAGLNGRESVIFVERR